MSIKPICAALTRHKLTAFLLAAEVALTCAIVCNMLFLISTDLQRIHTPTGLDESGLVLLESTRSGVSADNIAALHAQDLARLRTISGVTSATAVDSLPLSRHNWTSSVHIYPSGDQRRHGHHQASLYDGTPGELATLGLELVAGRDFRSDEYISMDAAKGYTGIDRVPAAIVTQALARRLFPDGHALGHDIYVGDGPTRIVGIVRKLVRPDLAFDGKDQNAILLPMVPDERRVIYALRVAPGQSHAVLKAASSALKQSGSNRVLGHVGTFHELRAHYFRSLGHAMGILVASCICLLLVTAFGIFGLASFWVRQRRRQIGIRRALGATRHDILQYFQLENFLIVTLGVALGVVLAFGLSLVLLQHYAVPRLPFYYLPISAAVLWLLGQLAVFGPALRASHVPPVVATRSV